MSTLAGKTLFITGASRGIGLAIAKRAARDGANVAIAAKTAVPHARLEGTIHTAAAEIVALGGKALAFAADVRQEEPIRAAMAETAEAFGSIDILINNASAIRLGGTLETGLKDFDLIHSVNARGTYLCSRLAIPYLSKGSNPHILNLSPPLNLKPEWSAPHVAYTISKYGMSLCTLGMAEELRVRGIAVNSLWPRTTIATAAVRYMVGGEAMMRRSRTTDIMADAAHAILTQPSAVCTGNFFIDEAVLRLRGVADFEKYAFVAGSDLQTDLFI
jgi:citronellol/citronellal dehydrogenase